MTTITLSRAVHEGNLYVTAQHRGSEYTLQRLGDAWFVSSRRLALGRSNMGGGKHYANLAEVAAGCKAFGCEADLIATVYGVTATE